MRIWVLTCAILLGLAAPALADHREDHQSLAGGEAADHRSEQAVANSNAQWQEGARRGLERAEQRAAQQAERLRELSAREGGHGMGRPSDGPRGLGGGARAHGRGRGR
jgi:hypothetical protein